MIGKFKQFLGIEGLKIEIVLPETIDKDDSVIHGHIRLYSLRAQDVSHIRIALVERYSRGRGSEKLIDEYELGGIAIDQHIHVPAKEVIEVAFSLPFTLVNSDAEDWASKNILFRGIAGVAKKLHQVKSEFRLEAQAKVSGMGLSPFDKIPVVFS